MRHRAGGLAQPVINSVGPISPSLTLRFITIISYTTPRISAFTSSSPHAGPSSPNQCWHFDDDGFDDYLDTLGAIHTLRSLALKRLGFSV
jgi:hypothetical protein